MRVRLVFFAALRERMGARAERSVEPGTTVGALWRALVAERPELARILVRFAVNEVYVEPGHRLADGDEVAFFPPVSGGAREASSGRGAEPFAACRWLIDGLKAIVPVWKREHFRGGRVWIGPQSGTPSRRPRAARRPSR